jgi:leucyl aminopeptidase (aminopeptidase T)
VRNRRPIASTGVLRKIGESGNLPSGEVYIAPWEGKSNGIVVFDGSIAGIGLLENPVSVEIKDGYIESITGKTEAKIFEEMLEKVGRDAFALAEFGIGTNYKAKLCGDILEDEKVLGTIHVAFGNNISMGGKISVQSHVDGLVKKPTVYFDDFKILDNGKLTIEVEEGEEKEEVEE